MQPDDEVYVGLIYNASSPPDPFDEDSGDCLPQNAKELLARIHDPSARGLIETALFDKV